MPRFVKKPIQIEAVQYLGEENWDEMKTHIVGASYTKTNEHFHIATLEGAMLVAIGDWVVRGVAGEYYPCKPDIFEATYTRLS